MGIGGGTGEGSTGQQPEEFETVSVNRLVVVVVVVVVEGGDDDEDDDEGGGEGEEGIDNDDRDEEESREEGRKRLERKGCIGGREGGRNDVNCLGKVWCIVLLSSLAAFSSSVSTVSGCCC